MILTEFIVLEIIKLIQTQLRMNLFNVEDDLTPPANPKLVINSGAQTTDNRTLNLEISATDNLGVTGFVSTSATTPPINHWMD